MRDISHRLRLRAAEGLQGHLTFSLVLAALWAFHAAAFGYVGRAYFHVTHLNAQVNGITQPVGPHVLLHPAFLCAVLLMFLRGHSTHDALPPGSKCGIVVALCCWMFGATLSTLLNFTGDQVVLTYCSVFLAGAAVYIALSRTRLTPGSLEIALLGLAIGSLFPLVGGIQAFVREWGTADIDTTLVAYQNLFRMELYEAATFGSRGNTATFVIIVAPLFLWTALDPSRSRLIRILSAAMLIPLAMNVLILEIRAAFFALLFALSTVFGFKLGLRRYPLFAAGLGLSVFLLVQYAPDNALMMSDRLRPIMTLDSAKDASVMERAASIDEGLKLAKRNWFLGIGPGAGAKRHTQTAAHQFEIQEFMEVGILGLVASAIFSLGVLIMLARTLARGQDLGTNNLRFALLIGPATFVVYGIFSNPTLTVGYVNTWSVLVASMLALMPGFDPGIGRRRRLAEI